MPVNTAKSQAQWERFRYCIERGHYEFVQKADKCDKFFAGDQWDPVDLSNLKAQRRPALTINKIISTVATILGEQIYNRNETIFRPAAGATADTADALTKVWAQLAQENQLQWVRSDVFADGVIRSRGFYDVRMSFDDAMAGNIDIDIMNSKNVVIDPDAEQYDPDTWNDVFITKWLTPDDIALLYNKEDAEYLRHNNSGMFPYAYDSIETARDRFSGTTLQGTYYGQPETLALQRNIRTIERQYRKLDVQKHFVDHKTGDMRPVPEGWDQARIDSLLAKTDGSISIIKKLVKRIRWTVTADNVVLHDDWSPYKHFTVVPYFPYLRHGRTTGIVENLLGPQELLNKVSSQELHVVNTTANSGWKIKTGQLKNMSIAELEQNGSMSGLVLELDDVEGAQKILPNQTPNGLDRISDKAENHIKTISNITDSMQGNDREDVAAKAIDYKTKRGAVSLTKVLDNLERTDYILARNVLDLVQEYYTEQRLIHITHDDVTREPETIEVNKPDEATGEILNDLTVGKYSIIITSTPFRASLEDSQFEQALEMRKEGIQIPDSVLIENSRLLRRADIVKKMEAQANSPAAQAAAQLQVRANTAQVSKVEAEVGDKQADTQLKAARAKKEDSEAQNMASGESPEITKMRAEHEMEQQKHTQEMDFKEREFQQSLAQKKEMHDEEMRMKREQAAIAVQAAEKKARDTRLEAMETTEES